MAEILAEWELAPEVIIAALLHDVIEDASADKIVEKTRPSDARKIIPLPGEAITREQKAETQMLLKRQITEEFGEDIANIVEGLTKVDRLMLESREERVLVNLRRFFVAIGKDLRIVPIKLADRLHNMRTLDSLKEWKRKRTAKETLNLYAPLAYRFGMGSIQSELEDLAFEYLLPEIYQKLVSRLKTTEAQGLAAMAAAEKGLTKRLQAAKIPAKITTRFKHYYSIYRKMMRQKLSIDEVLDIVGMRVIATTERDCYRVLGEVHSLWLPIPGMFKDYIASCKPNMYQSLHTVVLIKPGYQMEIQIRTQQMHLVAERGIAAHWRYKAEADESILNKMYKESEEGQWVEEFITGYIEKEKGTGLLDDIRTMLQSEDVYVMTPRGEMRCFPDGSTLIDFAYAIHTSVGHSFLSGKVANVLKPPDYLLKTGDVIEIITEKSARPKKEWLTFVKTPHARHSIQKWFRVEERRITADIGRSVLNGKLRMAKIAQKEFYKSPALPAFIHAQGLSDQSDLFVQICSGKLKEYDVLQGVLPKNQFEKIRNLAISKTSPKADLLGRIRAYADEELVISDATSSEIILARCCHPIPGDQIVGYIKRGSGVTIHRIECRGIEQILPDSIRIIRDIRWDVPEEKTFDVPLKLHSINRRGILVDITKALFDASIDMRQLKSEALLDGTIIFRMDVLVSSASQLERALDSLKDIVGMVELERK